MSLRKYTRDDIREYTVADVIDVLCINISDGAKTYFSMTFDYDHKSGELILKTPDGQEWIITAKKLPPEE